MRTGFEYSDCWVEDSRLVVLNAMDAAERGATVLTRTRVVCGPRCRRGTVACGTAPAGPADVPAVTARALVNATGAWVNEVLGTLDVAPRQQLRLVQGSHLILRRLYEGDHAYLLQGADRRVVFMIPYEGHYTLVGTTDVPFSGDPGVARRSAPPNRDYLLDCLHRFFRRQRAGGDIVGSFSGVRPL